MFAWCYLWVIALVVARSHTHDVAHIDSFRQQHHCRLFSQKVLVLTNMFQRENWTNDSRNIENMQIYLTDECVKGLIRSIAFIMTSIMADITRLNALFSISLSLFPAFACPILYLEHMQTCYLSVDNNKIEYINYIHKTTKFLQRLLSIQFWCALILILNWTVHCSLFYHVICGYSWGLLADVTRL